jgi:nitronate monooxygenase
MWPRSDVTQLLGITHPIIQAPMSGFSTPQLVAAVSNAGALGSHGAATLTPRALRDEVAQMRQGTNRPFNINFFAHPTPVRAADAAERMRRRIAPYFSELGLGTVPDAGEIFPTFGAEQLGLIGELRPRVVSFHFGLPPAAAMQQIKAAGCVVLSSATTVAEARALEAQGADAIIAQGLEAGGHRGTFTLSPGAGTIGTLSPGAGTIGTLALVPQIVDAVRVPVIAAGGIADGRGIAAAFALGAGGVQIGTAFLGCPEAAVLPVHRQALAAATGEATVVTRVFTGRPARALRCRLTDEIPDADALDFPLQASLLAPLWRVADDAVRRAFMPMWAGQAASLVRELPAPALVEKLAAEAQAILGR